MWIYFRLWIFTLIVAEAFATCKNGWLTFEESCYYFGHSAVTFEEAEAYCREYSSHLIHINDRVEDAFVKSRLKELKDHNWWLGLTNEDGDGQWVWIDTNTAPEYTGWNSDQPDGNQPCSMMHYGGAFHWYDTLCTHVDVYALCETGSEESGVVVG